MWTERGTEGCQKIMKVCVGRGLLGPSTWSKYCKGLCIGCLLLNSCITIFQDKCVQEIILKFDKKIFKITITKGEEPSKLHMVFRGEGKLAIKPCAEKVSTMIEVVSLTFSMRAP